MEQQGKLGVVIRTSSKRIGIKVLGIFDIALARSSAGHSATRVSNSDCICFPEVRIEELFCDKYIGRAYVCSGVLGVAQRECAPTALGLVCRQQNGMSRLRRDASVCRVGEFLAARLF